MSAVCSYVATNWPNPDLTALTADIAARVLAADPGGRSEAAIARYASERFTADLAAWAMEREAEKRAAKAEAATEPITPTYPDRGVTLAEAKTIAQESLDSFAERIAAGEAPQLMLRMTVGSGKTHRAIDALPMLLAAGRAVGGGPVLFTHPRHELGDQIAADILERQPQLNVAVWRGRDAADPSQPGKAMCKDPELPRAAQAAGVSASDACKVCPLRWGCAYLAQKYICDVDVWIAPHQVLFLMPFGGWPRIPVDGTPVPQRPSAVIVDESVADAGLHGTNSLFPVQLPLSALASQNTPNLEGWDRERLLNFRGRALNALADQSSGGVFRDPLIKADFHEMPGPLGIGTQSPALEWSKLEWACKPEVKIAEGASREVLLAAYAEAAAQEFTRRRPLLAARIARFLETGDTRSVNLTLDPEAALGKEQGTGPAVRLAWREDFHATWAAAPMLFLDATGRPEVLRQWAPALEVVDIEVQAPYQHVVQVADRAFSRTMLTVPGNADRVTDVLIVELAQAKGPVLAVCQVVVEERLRKPLVARGGVPVLGDGQREDTATTYRFASGAVLHLAHHGDITGSNAWQDVATVIVIGRPATNRRDGERIAEVTAGRGLDRLADEGSQWPEVIAGIRMADGSGRRVERQPCHPDPLVEAGRWALTEGAVLQAIGRGRGVRRTAANPVRVVVLAALALPLMVAEVTSWDEFQPNRVEVAAAEAALNGRALPLAPADLAAARPDLWPSEAAVEHELKRFERGQTLIDNIHKGLAPFKPLAPARYRKGLRGRWSAALVPLQAGRAALEALVGPLAAFELVVPPAAKVAPAVQGAAEIVLRPTIIVSGSGIVSGPPRQGGADPSAASAMKGTSPSALAIGPAWPWAVNPRPLYPS